MGGSHLSHEGGDRPVQGAWRLRLGAHVRHARPVQLPHLIRTPEGPITLEGTRRNARTIIEYIEGWLNGRGAKGIDSLAGRPGVHPALMEDLATARISAAQTAQRILHGAKAEDTGQVHDLALVKEI